MKQDLEFVTKLIDFLEGLSAAKNVLNDPKKLEELSSKAAAAIALTDQEKAKRAEHEQFMAEVARFKERMEKHDAEKIAFAKEMQDQKDSFERLKTEHSKELNSKRLEISDRLDAISIEDKQAKTKHSVLREELKKKEARLHEHARLLEDKERDLAEREKELEKASNS